MPFFVAFHTHTILFFVCTLNSLVLSSTPPELRRYLVTQQINTKLRADLDFVVKKFEASEIQGVVDYVQALRVVRGTHALLAKNLPSLDAFDDVLAEVTETVGPMSFRGRVVMHVLSSLVMDLFPNYTYNAYTNRFVKVTH